MTIKRYIAVDDNTITNAYEPDLATRATGSNAGAADSVEIFSIFGQQNSASVEKSRTIFKFPILTSDTTGSSIKQDRTNGDIPKSGSVNFFLNLYNVRHDQTLPRNFTLVVAPLSQSWEEGSGVDLDNYKDLTYDGTGSNWVNAGASTNWVVKDEDGTDVSSPGGSILSASWNGSPVTRYNEFNYSSSFETGVEDLSVDITGLVEQWVLGTGQNNPAGNPGYTNYGVVVYLTASQESSSVRSYYTKRFSSRTSEYFFKRPCIEARWNSSRKDHRGTFVVSSSNLSAADNLNTIYLYNYVRGQLKDLAHPSGDVSGSIYVTVHTSASDGDGSSRVQTWPYVDSIYQPITGGKVSTGIYSASMAIATGSDIVYDRWWTASDGEANDTNLIYYHTGSINPEDFSTSAHFSMPDYVTTISNLREQYHYQELARFRLFTRLRNWNPTIYTIASTDIETSIVEDAYFRIYRVVDNHDVISYGTGSADHTKLSYDVSGSYFDLDMGLLEPGYAYGIKFCYYLNGSYREQTEDFKFRVEKMIPNV